MTPAQLSVLPQVAPSFRQATQMFTDQTDERCKYVMVFSNVANVTNKHMLIRRKVQAPAGLYHVDRDGNLMPARDAVHTSYPNVLTLEQTAVNQTNVHVSPALPKEVVGSLKLLCDEIAKNRGEIVLSRSGAWMSQNPQLNMGFEFGLPIDTVVDPRYLAIALNEMLQYPYVFLRQEIRPDSKRSVTPLILGLDWGSCAMIMPINTERYGHGEL